MKKLFVIFVVLFTFLLTGALSAQNTTDINKIIDEKVVANLVMAINSDNAGLRKSAIYLACKYQINGTVDALIHVLNSEESGSMKVLAALALYEIGSPKGLDAVLKSAIWDNNEFVKKMNSIIYIDYKQRMDNGRAF